MKRAPGRPLERRRSRRISTAPVSVVGARLVNVSPTGMMIESPVPLGLAVVHHFRLVVTGVEVDVDARVVACTPGRTGRRPTYGVQLEFTRVPPDARVTRVLAEEAKRTRS